ncbi:MAG: hypothetical protein KA248_13450 [Kiritimatiellae bacterium]|nr:hypothetical protein [Kiritimatiellia bacterium]
MRHAGYLRCAAAGLLLAAGCVRHGPAPADRGAALTHHNWWNYYARAVSRMDQHRYAEARADLETCLGLRPGARSISRRDVWRERTYGLHMIENYFPRRELGVCLYHLGDHADAIRQLEESLKQEPSGRAKHYLNLARQKTLAGRRVAPPRIEPDADATPAWTRARELAVAGTARGPGYVRAVEINGRPQFIELAQTNLPFSELVALAPGSNTIRVTAADLTGRTAAREFVCRADWQPPQIVLLAARTEGRHRTIEGACYDNEELAGLRVNGRAVPLARPGKDQSFRAELDAGEPLHVEAEDRAGHRIELTAGPQDLARSASRPPVELASAGDDIPELRAEDQRDAAPPVLRLADDRPWITISGGEFYLDGEAMDPGGLAGVTVNGEEWLKPEHRGATRHRFAAFLRAEGTNVFTVVARDRAGNRTERRLTVVARAPDLLNPRYRLRAVLRPCRADPAGGGLDADQATEHLGECLARPPARFRLLARGDEWTDILRELDLSASGLADPRAALEIGRLLPADLLFSGALFRNGDGVTAYMRIVDTASAEVLHATDVYIEFRNGDWRTPLDGLAAKMEQFFPLLESRLASRHGGRGTIAAGRRLGVRAGTRWVAPAADDAPFAELVVESVEEEQSTARFLPAKGAREPAPGDTVMTR